MPGRRNYPVSYSLRKHMLRAVRSDSFPTRTKRGRFVSQAISQSTNETGFHNESKKKVHPLNVYSMVYAFDGRAKK